MTRSRSSNGRPEPRGYGPRADRAGDPYADRYERGTDRFATGYGRGAERTSARSDDPRSGAQGRRGGGGGGRPPSGPGGGPPGGGPNIQLNVATVAVLAGVLVVGIGIGSAVTSTTQGNQGNIASAQQLDMAVPDPEFCKQWGASAFVMDIELYTTMNPSSSFVTQPTLQPGCVIRRENWSVLQKEGAVTAEQMRQCKQRMNTFAYIGSVRDKPVVRCVYQTDISGNKFQTRGIAGAADDAVGLTPEADQF
ncbi:DUF3172 domain-containing protein [Synechococcus sp. CCY 9618]|uniref:DUF3172 domain-containing protein n=1 Tax=Synechococcus sp. CCY 9618 TaxID=2815602 RepID=UPI001C218705